MKPSTAPNHTLNHLVSLLGGRITSVETAADNMYGLTVVKDSGEEVICWILRDPEGNGPGWLDIEEK